MCLQGRMVIAFVMIGSGLLGQVAMENTSIIVEEGASTILTCRYNLDLGLSGHVTKVLWKFKRNADIAERTDSILTKPHPVWIYDDRWNNSPESIDMATSALFGLLNIGMHLKRAYPNVPMQKNHSIELYDVAFPDEGQFWCIVDYYNHENQRVNGSLTEEISVHVVVAPVPELKFIQEDYWEENSPAYMTCSVPKMRPRLDNVIIDGHDSVQPVADLELNLNSDTITYNMEMKSVGTFEWKDLGKTKLRCSVRWNGKLISSPWKNLEYLRVSSHSTGEWYDYYFSNFFDMSDYIVYTGCFSNIYDKFLFAHVQKAKMYFFDVHDCTHYCVKKGAIFAGLHGPKCYCITEKPELNRIPDCYCKGACSYDQEVDYEQKALSLSVFKLAVYTSKTVVEFSSTILTCEYNLNDNFHVYGIRWYFTAYGASYKSFVWWFYRGKSGIADLEFPIVPKGMDMKLKRANPDVHIQKSHSLELSNISLSNNGTFSCSVHYHDVEYDYFYAFKTVQITVIVIEKPYAILPVREQDEIYYTTGCPPLKCYEGRPECNEEEGERLMIYGWLEEERKDWHDKLCCPICGVCVPENTRACNYYRSDMLTMIYLGCFYQGDIVSMNKGANFRDSLTLEACGIFCFNKGEAVFGVRRRICYCGGEYDNNHDSPPDCVSYAPKCTGNTSQTCGGIGSVSVYRMKEDYIYYTTGCPPLRCYDERPECNEEEGEHLMIYGWLEENKHWHDKLCCPICGICVPENTRACNYYTTEMLTTTYLGCFYQGDIVSMKKGANFWDSLTLEACGTFCFNKGEAVFGVRATICYCGGEYDNNHDDAPDCVSYAPTCSGNSSQTCGGFGSVSVYHMKVKPPVNLALKKPAFQKDFSWYGPPSRAVDGNTDADYEHSSCTHTRNTLQPWWAVDLGETTQLASVKITNRIEYPGRLSNFQIGTTNIDPTETRPVIGVYTVCASQVTAMGSAETKEFPCTTSGRYVIVQLKGVNFLSLCEVEVYGDPYKPPLEYSRDLALEAQDKDVPPSEMGTKYLNSTWDVLLVVCTAGCVLFPGIIIAIVYRGMGKCGSKDDNEAIEGQQ